MTTEISNAQAASGIAIDLSNFTHVMADLRDKVLFETPDNRICALATLLAEQAERLSSFMDILAASIRAEEIERDGGKTA